MKEDGIALFAILAISAVVSYLTIIAADKTVRYLESEKREVEFKNFQLKEYKGKEI